MKTLHELCGSGFCKKIGKMVLGKRGDELMGKIFDACWGSEQQAFGDEEKLSCWTFWNNEKNVSDLDFGCGR